jgi:hypothetical protein
MRCSQGVMFVREQPCLDVEPSSEAGQRPGGPDDPMARRHDRQGIPAVRRADRARGAWMPDLLRNLRVRSRLSERDGQQRVPHLALKRRPRHVELQRESFPPAREVLGELTLGLDEHRMPGVFSLDIQPNAMWPLVLPQDRRKPLVRGHHRKGADGRRDSLRHMTL